MVRKHVKQSHTQSTGTYNRWDPKTSAGFLFLQVTMEEFFFFVCVNLVT